MTMTTREADANELGDTGWAPFVALSIFLLVLGGLAYMHPDILGEDWRPTLTGWGPASLLIGVVPLVLALVGWMRSTLRFDAANRARAAVVVPRQRVGMILFLMSEGMLFFAFFWAFLRFAIDPELAGSPTWPPVSIKPGDPWGGPFFATIILVLSGGWAVLAHHDFLAGRRRPTAVALVIAIVFGAIFLGLQVNEFLTASFAYTAGSYASVFYLAVGFHGAHVLIGATLLAVSLVRLLAGGFLPEHHFGFEASVWYWHFVDAIWLLLFLVFYWLPSTWG